jgi:PAS domain S-box-containing protein
MSKPDVSHPPGRFKRLRLSLARWLGGPPPAEPPPPPDETTVKHLRFLSQTALELISLPDEESIYTYMGQKLYSLLDGHVIVLINRNENEQTMTIQGAYGLDETQLGKVLSLLGYSPVNTTYESDDTITQIFKQGHLVNFEGGLVELAKDVVPPMLTRQLVRLFNIGEIYLIGLQKDDEFYAGVQLYMRGQHVVEHPNLIETFVRQASTALQRIQAEKARQDNEAQLRALLQAMPDMMFRNDRDGVYLDYYAADDNLLLMTPEMFVGRRTQDVMPSHLAEQHLDYIPQVLETGEQQNYEYQTEINGQMMTFEARMVVCGQDEVLSIVRDITARKHMEAALRDSEERYRRVIDTMSEGVVLQNRDGVIQACNPAAERILGLTADQMMGLKSIDNRWNAVHEDGSPFPGEDHPAMVTLRTGEPQTNIMMGVYYGQDLQRWLSINSQPVYYDEANENGLPDAVVATFSDITDRRQAQAREFEFALEKERRQLLTMFFQNAAHEFRTPLAIINSSAYLMTRADDPDRRQLKADQINLQVNRITRLVDMLALMVRLSNEDLELLKPVNLKDVIASAREAAQPADDSLPVIQMEIEPGLPIIQADSALLVEAIHQLLDNALRAVTANGRSDGIITLKAYRQADEVMISVIDNGPGIPPALLPRIFETFWRGDDVHETEGFGLGLTIVQQIVERHTGTVTVSAPQGQGSTFTIRLPVGV